MTFNEFIILTHAIGGATVPDIHMACVTHCGCKPTSSPQTYSAVARLIEKGLLTRIKGSVCITTQGYDELVQSSNKWAAAFNVLDDKVLSNDVSNLPLGTIGTMPTKLGRPRTRPKTRAQEERERDRRENEEAIARDRERARAQRAEREAKASANEGLFSEDWDTLIKNANERDSEGADGYPDNAYYND